MDYEKNLRYFTPTTYGGPTFFIIVGIVLILIAFGAKNIWCGLIGTGLFALAILWIISKKKKIVSDEEYDLSVAAELYDLKQKALSRLGIDEDEVKEIEPISFDSYSFEGAQCGKIGKDGCWRTSSYKCIMMFFSPSEVHCYTYQFDTLLNKKTESTDVYFYRDVVSVSTASDTVSAFGRNDIKREYFKLTTSGGTSISISLRDSDSEKIKNSINAMRALLREKKQIMQ
ncbi:MAG TPA: hypothetical protein DDX91_10305 [Ruminococcaceae bacterium]|nr:hypothetical protein [Oscillospiraceae bacterium]